MNPKKRKIFIVSLILITLFVLVYIVYMFFGKGGSLTNNQDSTKIFDFGALTIKKKSGADGSKIGTNVDNVDLGTNTDGNTDTDTKIPAPGDIGYVGDTGQNPDIGPGGYVPLPDPDTFNPNGGSLPDSDIVKIDPTDEQKKKKLCNDPNLSKDVANIICEPAGPGVGTQKVTVANFSLNAEEQAELDRLSRMFARLAPFLKTESDIASEKSNMEAYQDFTVEATRLARETDMERLTSYYKGPMEIKSPFLNNNEFGAKLANDLRVELIGRNGFSINPLQIIGIKVGSGIANKIFDEMSDTDKKTFFEGIEEEVMNRLVTAIDKFVESQVGQTLGIPNISKDDLPCQGSFSNCSGSKIFEKTLGIY